MTMTDCLAKRWFRRYKIYFMLGFLIFLIQFVLGYLLLIFGAKDDLLGLKAIQIWQTSRNNNNNNNNNNLGYQQLPENGKLTKEYEEQNNIVPVNSQQQIKTKDFNEIGNNKNGHLKINELNFTPTCVNLTKEAISAVHRAKTQECKQLIVNTTCAIQSGSFYAKLLSNYCPNKNFIANRALGCFKDNKKNRILSGYYTNFKTLNTPTKCIQMCLQSGFLYAGVQYSTECFCGNTEPSATAKLPDPECNYKCIGDSKQICGGFFTVNIYETGISKFEPKKAELVPKYGDEKVTIVFLLTLNGRAVRQVYRLLKALYSKNHYFYIHVDARQDYMYRQLLRLESSVNNIRLARKRFSTIWGGASLLKMLLTSMTELQQVNWDWNFVINLSETDFLIKTPDKLIDFLSANKDRNFVKSHGREVQRFIQKQGLDKSFVECDTHMWRIGDRELPNGIQIDGGSDWIALSRNFVNYLTKNVDEQDELILGLIKLFYHTLLPAESFFHTALRNSRFCDSYIDNNLHMTNWKRRLGCKCQYKHVVDWCGCSPNDFRLDDWSRLLATETKQLFFARKFEPIINQAIILKLEEWLFGPYPGGFINLHSYWQSIYDVQDLSPEPDQTLLTISMSLGRIKADQDGFPYDILDIVEVHTYMQNDIYRGFLVRCRVTTDQEDSIELELWARPQQPYQASRTSNLGKRIKLIEVGTDYDQKEQIMRNFAKIIGPYSEPIVVMHLATGETDKLSSFNLTVLWINPAGRLADISLLPIEPSTGLSIHFAKSLAQQPLLPGVWSVKLIHKRAVIGQCKFLVSPLHESSISPQIDRYQIVDRDIDGARNWMHFLPGNLERDVMKEQALENTKRVGLDLLQWIDNLVKQFYRIRDTCIVERDERTTFDGLSLCRDSMWSSLAPDPKSDIVSSMFS